MSDNRRYTEKGRTYICRHCRAGKATLPLGLCSLCKKRVEKVYGREARSRESKAISGRGNGTISGGINLSESRAVPPESDYTRAAGLR